MLISEKQTAKEMIEIVSVIMSIIAVGPPVSIAVAISTVTSQSLSIASSFTGFRAPEIILVSTTPTPVERFTLTAVPVEIVSYYPRRKTRTSVCG